MVRECGTGCVRAGEGTATVPRLPAICDSCGALFPSGFVLEGAASGMVSGVKAGPCPRCGGDGTIPDGLYSAASETALAFTGLQPGQIQRFISVAQSAIRTRPEPKEVAARIKTDVPELSRIADALPRTRKELYAFLVVLLMIANLVLSWRSRKPAPAL